MALNSAAGPLLQLILFAVRGDAKLSTAVCRAVLRWPKEAASPPPDWVNKLTVDESGSHMMEAVIEALSPADRFSVVSVCFKGKLVQLCRHGLANHVMQRMMDRATEEPEVKTLIQELGPHIAELLQWNRPGVVKALAEACARSGACQADFLKGVVGALKVSSPKDNNRVIPSVKFYLESLPALNPLALICVFAHQTRKRRRHLKSEFPWLLNPRAISDDLNRSDP